jgi:hypothetical protein
LLCESCQHLFKVFGGFYFFEEGGDVAGFVEDEGGAFGAQVLFAVEFFFDPDAVEVDDGVVFVGDEGEGESVLLDELGVALDGVGADAEEEGFLFDLGPGVAEGAGLGGASGGVVFGVEVQDDFLAAEVAEGEGGVRWVAAADDGGGEVGGEGGGRVWAWEGKVGR